jgi:hypothetical protein
VIGRRGELDPLAVAGVEYFGQRVSPINCLGDSVVGLFGNQPAAGAQRRCHAAQSASGITQVYEKQPAVDQVVAAGFDLIAGDVTPAHLNVRRNQIAEEPRINVDRDDLPLRTHATGKPAHRRAGAGTDLQTAPSRSHADRIEVPERRRIPLGLNKPQAHKLVPRLRSCGEVASSPRHEQSSHDQPFPAAIRVSTSVGDGCPRRP